MLPEGEQAWAEEVTSLKPISFVSGTVFSGSQGGDRLLQGISCPGVYIWPQKKEREVGKGVGCRSGGTGSKRVTAKTLQAKREAGDGACPFCQVLLDVLAGAGDGRAKCSLKPECLYPQGLFSLLTSLGLGSWPCCFCPGATFCQSASALRFRCVLSSVSLPWG